jgi:N-acyl-D-aspartate/D-glutamate deacylase
MKLTSRRLSEIADDCKDHLTWGNTYGDGIAQTEEIAEMASEVIRLREMIVRLLPDVGNGNATVEALENIAAAEALLKEIP